jgi:uncharacterized protein (DUF952 family)
MTTLFHITTHEAWRQALIEGVYRADSLETEGFIHCSTIHQVVRTANRFYAGQTDLVLLVIDANRLDAELIYEESEPGERFPHLYGPLDLDAVSQSLPFQADPSGLFALPDDLNQPG